MKNERKQKSRRKKKCLQSSGEQQKTDGKLLLFLNCERRTHTHTHKSKQSNKAAEKENNFIGRRRQKEKWKV